MHARHITPYGPAECAWTIKEGQIEIVVVIPPNVTASVTLPNNAGTAVEVGSGIHHWTYPYESHYSLNSPLHELIDDLDAWNVVVKAIQQQSSGLDRLLDIRSIMLKNSKKLWSKFYLCCHKPTSCAQALRQRWLLSDSRVRWHPDNSSSVISSPETSRHNPYQVMPACL